MAEKRVTAEHGIVCDWPHERYGYFAWPTVARMDDGTLVVGASGPRFDHVCPWGKTSLAFSRDDGRTWSPPRILNDTPLDDRDCGVVSLGGTKLLVTWFAYDIRPHYAWAKESYRLDAAEQARWESIFATWNDELVAKWQGSWVRTSVDGEAWSDFIRAPVSAPHGPIRLASGDVLYLGKEFPNSATGPGQVMAVRSAEDGRTWQELGSVPLCEGVALANLYEPHAVELPSGRIVGLIRYEHHEGSPKTYEDFSMFQTESDDGGRTWTIMRPLGIYGSPPHVIRHSSGALVCVYSHRRLPHGQRAMISHDEGKTWDHDWILRDDAPGRDLGYPASVELPGGDVFTVYYQQSAKEHKNCGILWTRWRLPQA